nr:MULTISPECIES: signal peptidase I [Prochlorococcus]
MKKKNSSNSGFFYGLWDFWGPLLVTLSLYTGIRVLLAEARYIPSGSMTPTLQINDRLFIEKLTFRRRTPKRGEIVVFNSPHSFDKTLISQRLRPLPSNLKCVFLSLPIVNSFPAIGDQACDAYIKRVVAIEGDEILVGLRGELYVNGELLEESYVRNYCGLSIANISNCKALRSRVPEGNVFVLGDNRSNSWDGRYWPASPFLPTKEIIGKASWRFWPLTRMGPVHE